MTRTIPACHRHSSIRLVTDQSIIDRHFGVSSSELQTVGEVVVLRLRPGSGEADRTMHVRRLLDVSAELNYAISTYTHRVLMFAGRRSITGDLRDETAALQDALDAFAKQVRTIATAYGPLVKRSHPSTWSPEPAA